MSARSRTHLARRLPVAAALIVLAVAQSTTTSAQCPSSTVACIGTSVSGVEEFNKTEASADAANSVSVAASSAAYDLAIGAVSAIVNVDDVWRHRSTATAVDRFELQGVPSAAFKVRLHLSLLWVADPGLRQAWAGGDARLAVGDQTVQAGSFGPSMDAYIELDLSAKAGEPFTVTYEASAVASGYYPSCTLNGQLEFVGVPEGGVITSCNGFRSEAVSVEQSTWSRVKALYR
jgi:hypothetical protein